MQENVELIQKGFRILLPQLSGYIGMEMSRVYGDAWWQEVLDALSDQRDLPESGEYGELLDSLDVANCLRLIDRRWRDVFSQKMSKSYRNWASELMGVRNDIAHAGSNDVEQGYTERALDTMALLCEPIDGEATEEIRSLYRKVRYGSEQGSMAKKENSTSAAEIKAVKKVRQQPFLRKMSETIFPAGGMSWNRIRMSRKVDIKLLSSQRIWHRYHVEKELTNTVIR